MPYSRGNYSLVADMSFNPYQTLSEMMIPFTLYKEEVDKRQAALDEYSKNMSTFAYLEDRLKDNPNSAAAQMYTNYKNSFDEYAKDFARNGLTAENLSPWLNIKRRYAPEIGLLEAAEKKREAEFNRRMANKDLSMLYATDKLDIDDFLGDKTPNLYSISGNALFTKGAALGKAMADRKVYSGDAGSVLGNYYRNWRETKGIAGGDIREFMAKPEVQEELDKIRKAEGLDNLSGINRERAEAQLLSGMATGITYEEKNQLHRDLGKKTAAEEADDLRANQSLELSLKKEGLKYNKDTKQLEFDADRAQQIIDFYKKNPQEGYEIVPDSNGMPTYRKKSSTKESKTPEEAITQLHPAIAIDEDGNEKEYKSSTKQTDFYEPLDYAQASTSSNAKWAAKVAAHHPGWGDCYQYKVAKQGGKKVLLIIPDKVALEQKIKNMKAQSSDQSQTVTQPAEDSADTNDLPTYLMKQ